MTITLASLIARLTADVPADNGVPSTAQYTQAVKDAVADLSRRASVTRQATLAIVAGTADYPLPSDFQTLIRLSAIGVPYPQRSSIDYGVYGGGVLVTPSGLVPFSSSYREQLMVAGDTLTIYPTPTVSASRQLVYAAGDALSEDGTAYPTLTEDRAAIALLLASATCLERLASSPGGQALKVTTALGETVDFGQAAAATRTRSSGLRDQYLQAVASLNAGAGGLG